MPESPEWSICGRVPYCWCWYRGNQLPNSICPVLIINLTLNWSTPSSELYTSTQSNRTNNWSHPQISVSSNLCPEASSQQKPDRADAEGACQACQRWWSSPCSLSSTGLPTRSPSGFSTSINFGLGLLNLRRLTCSSKMQIIAVSSIENVFLFWFNMKLTASALSWLHPRSANTKRAWKKGKVRPLGWVKVNSLKLCKIKLCQVSGKMSQSSVNYSGAATVNFAQVAVVWELSRSWGHGRHVGGVVGRSECRVLEQCG